MTESWREKNHLLGRCQIRKPSRNRKTRPTQMRLFHQIQVESKLPYPMAHGERQGAVTVDLEIKEERAGAMATAREGKGMEEKEVVVVVEEEEEVASVVVVVAVVVAVAVAMAVAEGEEEEDIILTATVQLKDSRHKGEAPTTRWRKSYILHQNSSARSTPSVIHSRATSRYPSGSADQCLMT